MIDYIFFEAKGETKGSIVMIPGFAHTKEHYLQTPDKREGWAYNFSELGYDVYCINWPGINSYKSFDNQEINSEKVVQGIVYFINEKIQGKVILLTHSAAGPFGWKLAEVLPQIEIVVGIAPGQPGNIQAISEVKKFSNTEMEVLHSSSPYHFDLNKPWEPSDSWIKNKLIGTSKHFPLGNYQEYKESLISVPSRVIYERFNINDSQLKVNSNKIKENKTKILIFTGTDDSSHPREIDSSISEWFISQGIDSEFHWLGDEGFSGNGHMMMLEKNSKEIAMYIESLILTRLRSELKS